MGQFQQGFFLAQKTLPNFISTIETALVMKPCNLADGSQETALPPPHNV